MTDDHTPIPNDWDALVDHSADSAAKRHPNDDPSPNHPTILTMMASAWADLVGILAVCTAALIAILILGERPAVAAFGWAAALGVVWWAFAAAVLVVVRQATPGMLLAGVSFAGPVRPARVGWVLSAALIGVVTLGLSGIIGGRGSLLHLASASQVVDGAA
jgi:hypothetical protein